MKTARLHILIALAISLITPVHAQLDDFNDGNDTGWQRYNPIGAGSFTFPNGAYRIQSGATPNPDFGPGRSGAIRPDAIYTTNFYVSVDITNWNDTINQSFGLLGRITDLGAGSTKGYAFTYDRGTTATSGDVDISRIDNEAPSGVSVSGADAIHLVPGRTYRFVFLGIDSVLEGRVYEHPNLTNPVVRVTGSDSVYGSGACGLVVYANVTAAAPDATFDNYFATNSEPIIPPPLLIEPGDGGFWISWSTNAAGFVLQMTPDLSANPRTWIDILDPFELDGRYRYFEFATTDPKLFFRLRRPPE
jgi:hypothetical protein